MNRGPFHRARALFRNAVLAACAAIAAPALASPTIDVFWNPSSISAGGTTQLYFFIVNTTGDGAMSSGTLSTITYPSGVVNTSTPIWTNTCSGVSISAPAGGNTVSWTNLSLAASDYCSIGILVTSATEGTYSVTIPPVGFTASTGYNFSPVTTSPNLTVTMPTITVTSTADSGAGTLRQAITDANTNCGSGPWKIAFGISGAGPHLISAGSSLPTITCSGTVIDGYTQPGAAANTLTNGSNNADIRIQIDSASPASCHRAFGTNFADNVIFRGLSITQFACDAIYFNTCTGCAIEGSYINVTPAGDSTIGTGVYLNTVSGTIGGAAAAQHNLWAGSGQIYLNTSPVLIKNNRFNVGRDGLAFASNRMSSPIYLNATGVTIAENIFLSTSSYAIYTGSSGNLIDNNQFRGVRNAVYLSTGGNTFSNNAVADATEDGIYVSSPSNTIQANTITNSAYSGIYVSGTSNTISSNLIEDSGRWGIESSGWYGLYQANTVRNNLLGGIKVSGLGVEMRGNASYSNGGPGIDLDGDGPTANDEDVLPYDADTGANDRVNYPVIASVTHSGGNTIVTGTLKAAPVGAEVIIELFSHPSTPAVNGGQTYLGSNTSALALDANGFLSWSITVPGTASFVSATATVDDCNDGCYQTSEYSAVTAPSAPIIGTATAGNGQATIAFSAPAQDGGSPITSYTATSSPGGIMATGAASPITVAGLTNGTAYTFTVTATNSVGTGPASAASNSVTPVAPATVPGAPVIGTATAGNGQATVTFTPPASDGGSPITSYTATSSPGGFMATGVASPLVVSGLTNGTAYTFTVTATNAVGTSAPSAASSSVTPATVPGAPAIGTATAGNGQATVTFTPPASDGGSTITSFTASSNPGGITATSPGSPITIPGLTNGTAYTFTVTATNAVGTGPASAASNSITPNELVPTLAFSASSLDFGDQTVNTSSSAQLVTLSNPQTSPVALDITSITIAGDFGFTGCATPITLSPGASCTLSIHFFPTTTGNLAGSVSIVSNASGSPHEITLGGTGTPLPVPGIALAPTSVAFGAILTGASASQVLALSNPGTANLDISSIAVIEPVPPAAASAKTISFSHTHGCPASLAPSAACNITVTYAPTVAGSHVGELHIVSNAVPSPLVASLSGSATPATTPGLQLSASSLTFAPQFPNTTSTAQSVTLTSSGTAPLVITQVAASGDFGFSGCGPSTLGPGATCSFAITFKPLSEGPHSGAIVITSDAPGSPHTLSLSGTGSPRLAPEISLSPSSFAFGPVRTHRTVALTSRLTNAGAAALEISQISSTGSFFALTNNCPTSLAIGAFCDLTVTYAPTVTGPHSGQLVIHSNALPSPYIAALSGTGSNVPPPFLDVDGALDFGQQVTGVTVRRKLTLANTGGDPLNISQMTLIGSGAFGIEGACASIAPERSCDLTVTFTPMASAAFTARLDIVSNHSGGVVQVSLSGVGTALPRPALELSVGALGFGSQGVGSTSASQNVRLTSIGAVAAQINSITPSLPDFVVDASQCPALLAPQQSCDIGLVFKPVASGARIGFLMVHSDAVAEGGLPHSVSLIGVGCRFFSMGAARNPSRLCAP